MIPDIGLKAADPSRSNIGDCRKWADFRREEWGEKDVGAVFPAAVAPKYSGEDPEKARAHPCADQFTANQASNADGDMKWVDRDGDYCAGCVSRLKG